MIIKLKKFCLNINKSQEETVITKFRKELLNAGGIDICYPDFKFDKKVEVISYSVYAYTLAGEYSIKVKGTKKFNKDVKKLIKEMRRNERLNIEDVKVKLEDGTIKTLNSVTVKIRN
jgi:hypothetical protein